ncbi:MAG: Fic family protein [Verrucomicrobia bacterium]|nr:Fic family protein [Verrucomicrobiota bacterium]
MNIDLTKILITPEILTLISEIDEFKGAWELLSRLTPERLQQLKKVATIESIGSSTRIEGSKLSDREVEQLLANLNTYSFISRDEQEVAGYAFVCEEIFQGFESIPFTENIIKKLHGWLLKFSDKDQRHRGDYKQLSNNVEAFDEAGKSLGVVFETASPFETPLKMQELIFWTREQLEQKTLHPLLIIGIFIVVFLAIHPFQDGNGRLSRCLTTLLLLKSGYLYVPYLSLESIIEHDKRHYYFALRKTQASLKSESLDFGPWLLFFLRALQKQKTCLAQKISKEKALIYLPELAGQIINLIYDHGRLDIGNIEKLTGANRNTLKKHLANLTKQGSILRLGKGKGTWYTLP